MQESTSTSKVYILWLLIVATAFALGSHTSFAQEGQPSAPPADNQAADGSKTAKPEEEDYSGTPFTEYGEFNETEEEEADAKFFQFGRFFGVSLGMGFQFIDGNRGSLWQGGFPVIDFKIHYWFDFNVGLDLGFNTAYHFYRTTVQNQGHVDVNWLRVGVNIKYYFPVKNLSAAISFANPYIFFGVAAFSKSENSISNQLSAPDNSMGLSGGAGLEFVVSPKKTYVELEFRANIVNFQDTFTTVFAPNLPNLTGNFYNVVVSMLFTW